MHERDPICVDFEVRASEAQAGAIASRAVRFLYTRL